MNSGGGRPDLRRVFLFLAGLSFATTALPVDLPGRHALYYLAAQFFLVSASFALAVYLFIRVEGRLSRIGSDISTQVVLCAGFGAVVQAAYRDWPLIPLIFFIGYPHTLFSRRFSLFWVPSLSLFIVAAGRYFFSGDPALFSWAAVFLLYSAALGIRMYRDGRRIEHLQLYLKRINSDAREMMDRIRGEDFSELFDRIRGDEAARAIALDEDDYLQGLLKWGCRVFNARTGILLVPDKQRIGFFRMRAAVHRGVRILEGFVPGDKGFIHITKERGGILCVSDASSAGQSLSFYTEDTRVGSFLVKVVEDPLWGRDLRDGGVSGKIRCVLYFDSEAVHGMSLDDKTSKRLDEFGNLVLRAMDTAGLLQKLTWALSQRDSISRYARRLTESLDPVDIADMALIAVLEAAPECDGAAVMLYDKGLYFAAYRGDFFEALKDETIQREEPSQMGLFLRRFAEMVHDQGTVDGRTVEIAIDKKQQKRTPFFLKGERMDDMVSFAAIPSFMAGTGEPLKGVVAAVSRRENVFGRDEMEELRTIAGMMAPALDNAITHRKVDKLSRTDSLTGLLNRRYFTLVFEGKLSNLSRGYVRNLAVIMIDADRFKDINDTHGHPVGDEVLVEIARRIRKGIRKNDAVARYGGEEFVVVLDNAGETEAREIAEKMRRAIRSRPFATSAGRINLTASFGFSVASSNEAVNGDDLLEQADHALYTAKETGRDKVVGHNSGGAEPEVDFLIREGKKW